MNKNSLVIHETEKIVVIVAGLKTKSINTKTGGLLQVYILVKADTPINAHKIGLDSLVCGECVHRGQNGKNRSCYVEIGKAPGTIWKSWKAGRIATWSGDLEIFRGRQLRWGAYGDPVNIPLDIMTRINAVLDSWTGYTHQADKYPDHADVLQVSCDTIDQAEQWQARGFNTFRVTVDPEVLLPGERICPSYTHGANCADCMACRGKTGRSFVIPAHGIGARNFTANISQLV